MSFSALNLCPSSLFLFLAALGKSPDTCAVFVLFCFVFFVFFVAQIGVFRKLHFHQAWGAFFSGCLLKTPGIPLQWHPSLSCIVQKLQNHSLILAEKNIRGGCLVEGADDVSPVVSTHWLGVPQFVGEGASKDPMIFLVSFLPPTTPWFVGVPSNPGNARNS